MQKNVGVYLTTPTFIIEPCFLNRKVRKNFYASKHKNFSVRENGTSVSFNGFYRDLF
jgi:hypothetical protein